MDRTLVVKGITALMLVGIALEGAHAGTEAASNEPAVEVRAADQNAASDETKVRLPDADAAAAVPAKDDGAASVQKADGNTTTDADAPAPKPGILQRAMDGVATMFERAKNFVMPSEK